MSGLMNVNGRYLWMNIKLMNIVGIWPESVTGVMRCCFAIVMAGIMFITQCSALRGADMTEFTELGSTAVQLIMMMLKLVYILIYRREVLLLVRETQKMCLYLANTFPHLRHLVENREKQLRIVTLLFLGFTCLVGVCWMSYPIMIFSGMMQGEVSLPLKGQFPLDISDPFYLNIVFLYEMIFCAIFIPLYPVINTFFICLIILTCGQMKILCSVLTSVNVKNGDEMLHLCIHIHNSILIFGKELRLVLDPIITMVYLIAMPTICQIGFQVTAKPSTLDTLKFLGMLIMVLTELWLCCYFSSELVKHSRDVQLAAYSCPWYSMTARQKKAIALVILRSQRPISLSVGRFHTVSLSTFTDVVKYSYTMLTVLNQVTDTSS